MFTVSVRGVYGLSAMLELARFYQQGPRQIKDIARSHNIPRHYLEQILVALKKSELVESYRGAQGGYALTRDPSKIRLIDILSLLEGNLQVLPVARKDDSLSFFWQGIEQTLQGELDRSLAELLTDYRNRQEFSYSI